MPFDFSVGTLCFWSADGDGKYIKFGEVSDAKTIDYVDNERDKIQTEKELKKKIKTNGIMVHIIRQMIQHIVLKKIMIEILIIQSIIFCLMK